MNNEKLGESSSISQNATQKNTGFQEYFVDLHTHSTCSDGALSPKDLVEKAINSGIKVFSITDHDCVTAYQQLNIDDYNTTDFRLITGAEFSTVWSGTNVHIVGLNIDVNSDYVSEAISYQTNARIERLHKICHKLQKLNLKIDPETFINDRDINQIGRPHIARYLVDSDQIKSVDEAFRKYLGAGKVGDIKDSFASLEQVISWINSSGGKAVVAHPNHYKFTRTKMLRFLDDFIAMEGVAMEVYSGSLNSDVIKNNTDIARNKKLLVSVGSDYHNELKYRTGFGESVNLPNNLDFVWECL